MAVCCKKFLLLLLLCNQNVFFLIDRIFGGNFGSVGSGLIANNIATFDGSNFGILGNSSYNGVNYEIFALAMNGLLVQFHKMH